MGKTMKKEMGIWFEFATFEQGMSAHEFQAHLQSIQQIMPNRVEEMIKTFVEERKDVVKRQRRQGQKAVENRLFKGFAGAIANPNEGPTPQSSPDRKRNSAVDRLQDDEQEIQVD